MQNIGLTLSEEQNIYTYTGVRNFWKWSAFWPSLCLTNFLKKIFSTSLPHCWWSYIWIITGVREVFFRNCFSAPGLVLVTGHLLLPVVGCRFFLSWWTCVIEYYCGYCPNKFLCLHQFIGPFIWIFVWNVSFYWWDSSDCRLPACCIW